MAVAAGARAHDIVLVGASGFVGRLVAAHLARTAPAGMRIALAGRNRARVEQVRAGLGAAAADWPVLVASAGDPGPLRRLAESTRVVATTVGPYYRLGMPLVEACVRAGTHYADLTGEVLFVHETIARWHEAAWANGTRIVHGCGFDAVPSDLGVLLAALRARADGAGELVETLLRVAMLRGGVSGGTVATMREQVIAGRRDARAKRILGDPHALIGPDAAPARTSLVAESRPEPPLPTRGIPVARDHESGRWRAPWIMGQFNSAMVRRSNGLLGYGGHFEYHEVMDLGRGPAGLARSLGVAGGLAALDAAIGFGPTRLVVDRFLPSPGDGPDEAARRSGAFRIEIDAATSGSRRYRTVVSARLDPGYDGTSVMLGQAALSLALDDPREGADGAEGLPGGIAPARLAGVVTPASGLGLPYVERLRRNGFRLTTRVL